MKKLIVILALIACARIAFAEETVSKTEYEAVKERLQKAVAENLRLKNEVRELKTKLGTTETRDDGNDEISKQTMEKKKRDPISGDDLLSLARIYQGLMMDKKSTSVVRNERMKSFREDLRESPVKIKMCVIDVSVRGDGRFELTLEYKSQKSVSVMKNQRMDSDWLKNIKCDPLLTLSVRGSRG